MSQRQPILSTLLVARGPVILSRKAESSVQFTSVVYFSVFVMHVIEQDTYST